MPLKHYDRQCWANILGLGQGRWPAGKKAETNFSQKGNSKIFHFGKIELFHFDTPIPPPNKMEQLAAPKSPGAAEAFS